MKIGDIILQESIGNIRYTLTLKAFIYNYDSSKYDFPSFELSMYNGSVLKFITVRTKEEAIETARDYVYKFSLLRIKNTRELWKVISSHMDSKWNIDFELFNHFIAIYSVEVLKTFYKGINR